MMSASISFYGLMSAMRFLHSHNVECHWHSRCIESSWLKCTQITHTVRPTQSKQGSLLWSVRTLFTDTTRNRGWSHEIVASLCDIVWHNSQASIVCSKHRLLRTLLKFLLTSWFISLSAFGYDCFVSPKNCKVFSLRWNSVFEVRLSVWGTDTFINIVVIIKGTLHNNAEILQLLRLKTSCAVIRFCEWRMPLNFSEKYLREKIPTRGANLFLFRSNVISVRMSENIG